MKFYQIIFTRNEFSLVQLKNKRFILQTKIGKIYAENGFFYPLDAITQMEAKELRKDYEAAEKDLQGDLERLALLKAYPNRLLPSFDTLTRNEILVDAAKEILGENILVWSAALFIKEAQSPKIVSWHQDLTYWQLNDIKEVTSWLAISSARKEAGCMKFIPGSHKNRIVPHIDTFDENNMLSRGQEISVEVNEQQAVYAELDPGQASFHHGLLFHGSGPNMTKDRRIGSAIRFISASMKQETGDRPMVTQVSGYSDFGNFKILPPPKGRLLEEEFELCRLDNELKKKLLL
jgi:ectoine hydroxylase-related dioxygenase (phytanoyl-CoA dioxygenase family)